MSRQNQTFKAATNRALDGLEKATPGDALESEARLAERLEISRTTARGVLARLSELGVIDWDGRRKILLRSPLPGDRFPDPRLGRVLQRAQAADGEFDHALGRRMAGPEQHRHRGSHEKQHPGDAADPSGQGERGADGAGE